MRLLQHLSHNGTVVTPGSPRTRRAAVFGSGD